MKYFLYLINDFYLDNLDENQKECLRKFWILLIERLNNENIENFVNSTYGKELFTIFANDNPDSVVLRWLRARKWDINNALEQFIDTLKWRNQWGVNQLIANGESDLSREEIEKGKAFYIGYDRKGRPIHYVSIKDHIKGEFSSEQTQKLTVFAMELGRKLLHYPNETVTIICDLKEFSMKNMDYQHLKFLINILQNYYPESLGLVLIINSSWLFNSCWSIIKSWLDPIVENKIHFIKNLNDLNQFIDFQILSNFNYIQPTEHDYFMFKIFREDFYGKEQAIRNHQLASIDFIQITLKWIKQNQNNHLIEQRNKSIQQLSNTYEQLIPYISTKTHYHRIGLINEPIFDITFQKIRHL